MCGVWEGVPGISEVEEARMMIKWRELSRGMKVFYIACLISAIGLAIMILTGWTSIGDTPLLQLFILTLDLRPIRTFILTPVNWKSGLDVKASSRP
jgi:hypothetical protein